MKPASSCWNFAVELLPSLVEHCRTVLFVDSESLFEDGPGRSREEERGGEPKNICLEVALQSRVITGSVSLGEGASQLFECR